MFSVYGELTNAKAIAAKIVASRDEKINTIDRFKSYRKTVFAKTCRT